eukprot:759451-Hanusia_phi.AAC.7
MSARISVAEGSKLTILILTTTPARSTEIPAKLGLFGDQELLFSSLTTLDSWATLVHPDIFESC